MDLGRAFQEGKLLLPWLRRFLRSFGSILGKDLGTKVDVYESVDPPLGDGIFWLNLAATEGAGFVPGSSSNRLIRHRFDL